jgi:tetratricopeptide (TPR) repeat protein
MAQATLILFLVLSLSPLHVVSQQQAVNIQSSDLVGELSDIKQETDSLKTVLKNTILSPAKAEVYGRLCSTYAGALGDVRVARQYADSVKWVADYLKNDSTFAASNYYYGLVERYEGKYAKAIGHFQRHLAYCTTAKDSIKMAGTLFQMAVVQQGLGNYDESLAVSYQAIKMFEKNDAPYGMAITFMHIGNLFGRLKKVDEAVSMYRQSLSIFDTLDGALKIKMNKLRVLINLGRSYTSLKEFNKAMEFYSRSLVISRAVGSKRTTATTLSNIGKVLNELGQHDKALKYHHEALMIREETSQSDKIMVSLLLLGETHLSLGDYASARQYFLRALSLSKQFQSKPVTQDAYQKLSTLYSREKNYQKAFEYHQLFTATKDSLLNEETANQLSKLQTKYESEEKDKQITLLAKEKEFQSNEMRRQAMVNKAYVGGLILLLIVSALILYIVRQHIRLTAKNNEVKDADFKRQLTELEMKALRAQINPHFLFNCMNAINLMILKGQTENASLYLAKFSKLVRLILENAETSAVTLESEMALLESYIQLEELRLPGRISYRISVDESIGIQSTYMPSMVLQPVVENAIWHGIVHKENEEKGNIFIHVRQHDDQLLCTIEDNGVGRDKAQMLRDKSIIRNKSLGMKITEDRLRLRNRNQIGQCIQITDLKDTFNHAIGTRVVIHIPIAEQND